MANHMGDILTVIGRNSYEDTINPLDTGAFPVEDETICLIFDEYKKEGVDFEMRGRKHGLLLCIEVFLSELEYAMKNGTDSLIPILKEKGHYPYSDLDREPVV